MPTVLFACDSCLTRAAVEAAEGMGYLREGDGLYRTAEEATACEAKHVSEAERQEEERRLAAERKAAERLALRDAASRLER